MRRLMQICQVLCGRIVEFVNSTDAKNDGVGVTKYHAMRRNFN